MARPPSRKRKRRVGLVTGTWRMTSGLFLVAGSFTGDVPQKAWRGQTAGETIGLGWLSQEGLECHFVERSGSRQYAQAPPEVRPHYRKGCALTETVGNTVEITGVGYRGGREAGNQSVEGGLEESDDLWCTCCGWPLDGSVGESEDNYVRVPVPCAHGGFVHARCILDRAEHLARGHANPRPCVACRSAWPRGSRLPHPAEMARGLPTDEHGGR